MPVDPFAVSDVALNAVVSAAPALDLVAAGKNINGKLTELAARVSQQLAYIQSVDNSQAQLEVLRAILYQQNVWQARKTVLGV